MLTILAICAVLTTFDYLFGVHAPLQQRWRHWMLTCIAPTAALKKYSCAYSVFTQSLVYYAAEHTSSLEGRSVAHVVLRAAVHYLAVRAVSSTLVDRCLPLLCYASACFAPYCTRCMLAFAASSNLTKATVRIGNMLNLQCGKTGSNSVILSTVPMCGAVERRRGVE
eukprot:1825-Heterococcus_DN1.PRE.2